MENVVNQPKPLVYMDWLNSHNTKIVTPYAIEEVYGNIEEISPEDWLADSTGKILLHSQGYVISSSQVDKLNTMWKKVALEAISIGKEIVFR